MRDEEKRQLERRRKAESSFVDPKVLAEKVRRGEVSQSKVDFAAYLGDPTSEKLSKIESRAQQDNTTTIVRKIYEGAGEQTASMVAMEVVDHAIKEIGAELPEVNQLQKFSMDVTSGAAEFNEAKFRELRDRCDDSINSPYGELAVSTKEDALRVASMSANAAAISAMLAEKHNFDMDRDIAEGNIIFSPSWVSLARAANFSYYAENFGDADTESEEFKDGVKKLVIESSSKVLRDEFAE